PWNPPLRHTFPTRRSSDLCQAPAPPTAAEYQTTRGFHSKKGVPDSATRRRARVVPGKRHRSSARESLRNRSQVENLAYASCLSEIGRAPSELQSPDHLVCR